MSKFCGCGRDAAELELGRLHLWESTEPRISDHREAGNRVNSNQVILGGDVIYELTSVPSSPCQTLRNVAVDRPMARQHR